MFITKQAETVIWIASYPRSGNTWVQSVIREAGKQFGFPAQDLDVYKLLKEQRTPDVVGGIRPDISSKKTTVLKTHNPFRSNGYLHPRLTLETAGFVYVMRNPLDMLLSYINYTRMQYERKKDSKDYKDYQKKLFIDLLGYDDVKSCDEWRNMKLEDLARANLDHALNYFTDHETDIPNNRFAGDSWLQHCFSWIRAGKNLPSVFLKYENLLNGPDYFMPLKKLFAFSDQQIIEAVHKVNEHLHSLQYKLVFYNKMSSYYYPRFFSAAVIARFLERFEPELKQLGYANLYESGSHGEGGISAISNRH